MYLSSSLPAANMPRAYRRKGRTLEEDDNEDDVEDDVLPDADAMGPPVVTMANQDPGTPQHYHTLRRAASTGRHDINFDDLDTDDDKSDEEDGHQHTGRRKPKPGKNNVMLDRRPWINTPTFRWAVSTENPALLEDFLPDVLPKLKEAAVKLNLTISNRDLAWLQEHGGRFELFIPPLSKYGGEVKDSTKYAKMTQAQIDERYTRDNHSRFAQSPRMGPGSKETANTHRNYESALRLFWNFCAMIGAYDDMFIMLAEPPNGCPSISVESVR